MEPLRVDKQWVFYYLEIKKPSFVEEFWTKLVEEFWTNFVEEFCTSRVSVSRVFFLLWRQSELLSRQPYIMRKFLYIQIKNRPRNTKVIEFLLASAKIAYCLIVFGIEEF